MMRAPQHNLHACAALFVAVVLSGCNWPAAEAPGETCVELPGIPRATIAVDGNTADWAGIPAALTRPMAAPLPKSGFGLIAFYAAADSDKLYVRIDASMQGTAVIDGRVGPDGGTEAGPPPPGTSYTCRNGLCESYLGEDPSNCPEDCANSQSRPEFRINFKAPSFRSGQLSISMGGNPQDPWNCNGNWHSNNSGQSDQSFGCQVRASATSNPQTFELALNRSELGDVVSIYPTWGHCCPSNGPPVVEDEIGCVWSRLGPGGTRDGLISARDSSIPPR